MHDGEDNERVIQHIWIITRISLCGKRREEERRAGGREEGK
jgi:hypothetical protein